MPDITVHRHGDRWAVAERGAESPTKEFPSREAAEMAARQMAEGGTVEVLEEDPTSLERSEPGEAGQAAAAGPLAGAGQPGGAAGSEGAGEPAGGRAQEGGGITPDEAARSRQPGL